MIEEKGEKLIKKLSELGCDKPLTNFQMNFFGFLDSLKDDCISLGGFWYDSNITNYAYSQMGKMVLFDIEDFYNEKERTAFIQENYPISTPLEIQPFDDDNYEFIGVGEGSMGGVFRDIRDGSILKLTASPFEVVGTTKILNAQKKDINYEDNFAEIYSIQNIGKGVFKGTWYYKYYNEREWSGNWFAIRREDVIPFNQQEQKEANCVKEIIVNYYSIFGEKNYEPEIFGSYDIYEPNREFQYLLRKRNKYSDGTNTTFNSNNNDIRYAKGGLIAPNGKQSNLTDSQYKLVRTPAFKEWFGDWEFNPSEASKVVDENGEPLVVYHGTNAEFFIFGEGKNKNILDEYQEDYAFQKKVNYFHKSKEYSETFGSKYGGYEKSFFLDIKKIALVDEDTIENIGYWKNIYEYNVIIKQLDGIYSKSGQYATLLNPHQIKLADGTNTTFDSNNNDIRFDEGGITYRQYADSQFNEEEDRYLPSDYFEPFEIETKNLDDYPILLKTKNDLEYRKWKYGGIGVFNGNKRIAFADNGSIQVSNEYQGKGIGLELVVLLKEINPNHRFGNMTPQGRSLMKKYYDTKIANNPNIRFDEGGNVNNNFPIVKLKIYANNQSYNNKRFENEAFYDFFNEKIKFVNLDTFGDDYRFNWLKVKENSKGFYIEFEYYGGRIYIENYLNLYNQEKNKEKYKQGGITNKGYVSYKDKYNTKYGYSKGESHDLKEISKDTGVSMKGLQQIYNKGIGAYKTNPSSVRPNVKSKEQWAMARVYSSVMGGKASKIDFNELKMEQGGNIKFKNNNMSKHKDGLFVGKSHKEGGIPMVVKSTGQRIEVEGGESITNKTSMADDKIRTLTGTNCEIISQINTQNGNGVAMDCDSVVGKKYKYEAGGQVSLFDGQEDFFGKKRFADGGNVLSDFSIIDKKIMGLRLALRVANKEDKKLIERRIKALEIANKMDNVKAGSNIETYEELLQKDIDLQSEIDIEKRKPKNEQSELTRLGLERGVILKKIDQMEKFEADGGIANGLELLKNKIRNISKKMQYDGESGYGGYVIYLDKDKDKIEINTYTNLSPYSAQASDEVSVSFNAPNKTMIIFSTNVSERFEDNKSFEKYGGIKYIYEPLTNKIASEIIEKIKL